MISHDDDTRTETTERLAPASPAPGTEATVAAPAAVPAGMPPVASPDGAAPPPRRRRTVLIVVGAVVALVLVLVLLIAVIVGSSTNSRMEQWVGESMQQQTRLPVTELSCPPMMGLEAVLHTGAVSHCTGRLGGVPVGFTVTERNGLDDVGVVVDDAVITAKAEALTEQQLSRLVGGRVTAQCAPPGQPVVVVPTGGKLTCRVTGPTGRTGTITWTAVDDKGDVRGDVDPNAVRLLR